MLCLVCVTLQWHPRPFYKALATLLSSWVRARASASGCVYLAGNAEEKMSSDFRRFASACVKRGGTKVEPISASVMQSFIASRSVGRDACQKNGPMMLPYRNGIDYLARKRNAGYSGRRWARQATFHRAESSRLSRRRTVCKGYLGCCCCLIRAFHPRVRCNARRRCHHSCLLFIQTESTCGKGFSFEDWRKEAHTATTSKGQKRICQVFFRACECNVGDSSWLGMCAYMHTYAHHVTYEPNHRFVAMDTTYYSQSASSPI